MSGTSGVGGGRGADGLEGVGAPDASAPASTTAPRPEDAAVAQFNLGRLAASGQAAQLAQMARLLDAEDVARGTSLVSSAAPKISSNASTVALKSSYTPTGEAKKGLTAEEKKALDDLKTGADWSDAALVAAALNGRKEVVAALKQALGEKGLDRSAKLRILSTLAQIGTPEAAKAIIQSYAALRRAGAGQEALDLLVEMGGAGAATIGKMLADLDPELQAKLIPLLATEQGLKEPRAVAALEEALRSKNDDVRLAAGKAIALAGDAAPKELREAAMRAMAHSAASDKSKDTRWEAALALAELAKRDPTNPVALAAMESLAKKSHDANVVGSLSDAFTPEALVAARLDPEVSARILGILKNVAARLEKEGEKRDAVYDTIGELGTPAAVDYLRAQAASKDVADRKAAIWGLFACKDPAAAETLRMLAEKDPSPAVRKAAAEALSGIGERTERVAVGGWEEIAKAYQDKNYAKVAELVESASPEVLKQLDKNLPLPALLETLGRTNPAAQQRILAAFTFAAGVRAPEEAKFYQDALVDYLDDASPAAVRAYAEKNASWAMGPAMTSRAAATALARAGAKNDAAVETLLSLDAKKRPADGWMTDPAVRKIVEALPQAQLERVANAILKSTTVTPGARDNAAILLGRVGGPQAKKDAAAYFDAVVSLASTTAATNMPRLNQDLARETQQLNELRRLLDLARHRPGGVLEDLRDVVRDRAYIPADEIERLEKMVASQEESVRKLQEQREAMARQPVDFLMNPDVEAILATLPGERVATLLENATAGVPGTEAGALYAEKLTEAFDKPDSSPLWKKLVGHAKTGHGYGLKILENLAPDMIAKGELAYRKGMAALLGLKDAKELAEVEQAVADYNSATGSKKENAGKLLEKLGLKSIANKLDVAFKGIDFIFGMQKLFDDPNWKTALEAVKNGGDLAKTLGPMILKNPHLKKLCEAAGGVASVIGAVLQYTEFKDALERQDLGGAIGEYMQFAGNVLETIGTYCKFPLATGVGKVLGYAGKAVEWVWGDTAYEIELKALANKHFIEVKD